jgi:hypothetical protein
MSLSLPRRWLALLACAALLAFGFLATTAAAAHPAQAATATCSQAYLPLPDPSCQPGATYSVVTQSTIDSTICVSGWTATVRPPTSYTNALKVTQIAQYGYSDTSTADYEEDHLIPLELGGSPTSASNLWPEPHYDTGGTTLTSYSKDSIENKLKKAVCAGTVTLAAARTAIATNWTTALSKLGLS